MHVWLPALGRTGPAAPEQLVAVGATAGGRRGRHAGLLWRRAWMELVPTLTTFTMAVLSSAAVFAAGATPFGLSTARADTIRAFQTPSGNIACTGGDADGGDVACDIAEHSWTPPPRPSDCHVGGWGDRFSLHHGQPPVMRCHGDTLRVPGLAVLDYGQTIALGAITCDSQTTGMTCTDTSTGDFFAMSRDTYELHGS